MPANYDDRIEPWTSYVQGTTRRFYFSGYRIKAGSNEYAAVLFKDGRVSRGINLAKVESFGNRSQPAKALEARFQRDLENGNLAASIMERELAE